MTLQFGSSGIRGKYPFSVNHAVARELALRVTTGLGKKLAIGHDSRSSGPALGATLTSTALENGAEVNDFRFLPTPALSFETRSRSLDCGIMITASHNPPEYNGFKVFNSQGEAFDEESSASELGRVEMRSPGEPLGTINRSECSSYETALAEIRLKKHWRVVIDPGNGATCEVAPRVYAKTCAKLTSINCVQEPDFSGRGSEPNSQGMSLLGTTVKAGRFDAGIGFDGDGDRMVIVDEKGNYPLQDRVLGAFIAVSSRNSKGPFVVPIDASMAIDEVAERQNARIVRGPVGDAKLLREMRAARGTFAGEPSGAWIHPDFNPCPDGILSGLLFLQAVERKGRTVSEVVNDVPEYHMMRDNLPAKGKSAGLQRESLSEEIERVVGRESRTTRKFGLRVSTDESWALIRQSGTEPVLRVTVESKVRKEAGRIVRDTLKVLRRAMKSSS